MRWLRCNWRGKTWSGALRDDNRVALRHDAALPRLGAETAEVAPFDEIEFLPPTQPTKIICVGLNYRLHAAEMSKPLPATPLIFIKPTTALLAHNGVIRLPPQSQEVHHEAELAVVMGERVFGASPAQAWGAVAGFTCFNDVTARDIQKRENGQYTHAKGFDTFGAVGPWMVDRADIDAADARVVARVNGDVRQDGRTSDLIFPLPEVVAFISNIMTLLPGDLIATGTPRGVGPIRDGEVVSVEVEGIGALVNQARRAAQG